MTTKIEFFPLQPVPGVEAKPLQSYRVGLIKLNGKTAGWIWKNPEGYQYVPNGSNGKFKGEPFATLEACILSLK